MDGLDVLSTDAETRTNEALAVLGIFVGMGRLEPILTQVRSLSSPLQILLHELNLLGQPVDDPMEVPVPLEISSDTPLRHLISFFIEYLPMHFVEE